jgi:hypothetical protein
MRMVLELGMEDGECWVCEGDIVVNGRVLLAKEVGGAGCGRRN